MARETWHTLIALYLAAAALNLVFQVSVRSDLCAGPRDCAVSYAKAVLWSAIWPASVVVYRRGATA
jgi:hypothetical protein